MKDILILMKAVTLIFFQKVRLIWRNYNMNRNLDGVYFRIQRDEKWQNICFSDLTEEEMKNVMESKDEEWLKSLCIILGQTIHEIGEELDIVKE